MATVCANPLQFELDPDGQLKLKEGCGLETAPDGSGVRPKVQTWPYDCNVGDNGSPLYCDPITGELRGEPMKSFPVGASASNLSDALLNVGANRCVTAIATVDTTAFCKDVILVGSIEVEFEISVPAGGQFIVRNNRILDGGPVASTNIYSRSPESSTVRVELRVSRGVAPFLLAPGLVHTLSNEICVTNAGPGAGTVHSVAVGFGGVVIGSNP